MNEISEKNNFEYVSLTNTDYLNDNESKLIKMDKFKFVKFNFSDLKKFITMDLNIKVAFDDLKLNFSKLLKTSFFAKKLVFYNKEKKETIIDSSKSLEAILQDDYSKSSSVSEASQNNPLEFMVRIEQEGA